MNLKSQDPTDIVLGLLDRSACSVQVAACVVDKWGIYAWGWNHLGSGFGEHAEAHCLKRANPRRLSTSTLYIAARRARNGKTVTSRPCLGCERLVKRVGRVIYRDAANQWVSYGGS
jgi:deoxycytidylate deaminase